MKLKLTRNENGQLTQVRFWCTACRHAHPFHLPRWDFNGDLEKPTFSPSLRLYTPKSVDPIDGSEIPEVTVCHLFVEAGKIRYCGDCPHEYAGKVVPLEDFPENYAI
jgi:hypothetical protein